MPGADDQDEGGFRTVLEIVIDTHFLNVPITLTGRVDDTGEYVFKGEAKPDFSLSEFLTKLEEEQNTDQAARWDIKSMPAGDVTLDTFGFTYRSKPELFCVHSAIDVTLDKGPEFELDVAFARMIQAQAGTQGQATASGTIVVGIRSRGQIDLASVVGEQSGLVGQLLGGLHLDRLGVFYASDRVDAIEGSLFGGDGDAPLAFAKGPSFSARFGSADQFTDIVLPPSQADRTPEPARDGVLHAPTPAVGTDTDKPPDGRMRYWKDLDKTIGPLKFRRIGGEWHDNRIGLLLDASVSLLGLDVGLAGLAVRVPPSKLTSLEFADLEFGLDGLDLNFARGPIAIGGALLRTEHEGRVGYAGRASIRAGTFSVAAIGAYSTTSEGKAAFFIFGAYAGILGGPPCFVVEGIAAGFGYNRAITVPEIDKVRDFPLVSLVCGDSKSDKTSPMEKLDVDRNFPAVTGQYWIAAGVKFTSFKLIETFALVTVAFGTRFEIALLGVATMRQPPAPVEPTLVYVEMALKVRFAPDDGQLLVAAQLTANSYLFDPRCRLTGGFAFCVWFKPTNADFIDHSGDFVVTLGGYHPEFLAPPHYPKVPRVGFDWQMPECGVTIRGEAYFALTPSFIMAGARFSAVFQSGNFSAWFDVHADFLIGWAPLHYEAEVGLRIGAAYVLRFGSLSATLSFELQALLRIWGPPFAGEAYVDLGIIAFTVPLGDRSATRLPPKVSWADFVSQFVPPHPLSITIEAGLVEEQGGDTPFVIVNPSALRLRVDGFVPMLTCDAGQMQSEGSSTSRPLGIRPMGATLPSSALTLEFNFDGKTAASALIWRPILKNIPQALWSDQPMPQARTATVLTAGTIDNTLMGAQVLPADGRTFGRERVEITVRTADRIPLARPQDAPKVHARNAPPQARRKAFIQAWKKPEATVLEAMRAAGFDLPAEGIDLDRVTAAIRATPAADSDVLAPDVPDEAASVLWLAAPRLVRIDNLPPQRDGA